MQREFTVAISWKIIYIVLAIGFDVFLIYEIFLHHTKLNAGTIAPPVLTTIAAVLVTINMIRRKIIISDYSITHISVWGTRELANEHVKGFRTGGKAIYILPNKGYCKITLRDYLAIGNTIELVEYLNAHFVNLDEVEFQKGFDEILTDRDLGFTEDDRLEKFAKFRDLSLLYNFVGIILFVLALLLFKSKVYEIVNAVLFVYALAGFALICLSNGLVKLISKKNNANFQIYFGLFAPIVPFVIVPAFKYDLIDHQAIWLPIISITAALVSLLYFSNIRKSSSLLIGQLFFALIISLGFAYGVIIWLNCAFDKAPPIVYNTKVLDKLIHDEKKDAYFLKLSSIGPGTGIKEINVKPSFYDEAFVGKTIHYNLKHGVLGISWYYLSQ